METTKMPLTSPIVLVKEAVNLYKQHWQLWLSIMAVPTVVGVIVAILDSYYGTPVVESLWNLLFFFIETWAVLTLIFAMVRPTDQNLWSLYRESAKSLLAYWWIMIMVLVLVVIGLILLIIPGIVVSVWLAFSTLLLVTENLHGKAALKQSKEYVKGYWWPVFGRLVVMVVLMAFVSAIVTSIVDIGTSGRLIPDIFEQIISMVIGPFVLAYIYLLYISLRDAKKATIIAPTEPMSAPVVPPTV